MNDLAERALHLTRLNASLDERLKEISDLRERVDIVHTQQYASFLEILFSPLEQIFSTLTKPTLISDDKNNRIRAKALEVLIRLPTNDVLKPYAKRLFTLCFKTIRDDNEENALTALRIVFELERTFANSLESEASSFLELVQHMYVNLEKNVAEVFSEKSLESGSEKSTPTDSDGRYTILAGASSFRVMVECPLIVMLLFQLNSGLVANGIAALMPQMFRGLAVRIPAQAATLPNLSLKAQRVRQFRFECLLACQVKTLSFLTYLLMYHKTSVLQREAEIACHVVNLLKTTPAECISSRRELLVAMRHILATECARGFAPYLNALLDEHILLGVVGGRFDLSTKLLPSPMPTNGAPQTQILNAAAGGVQSRVPARKQPLVHLAYASLADLVQAMRGKMDLSQLSRIVYLFTRNVHDPCLSLSMQATSVRLLLNLVDGIYHYRGAQGGQSTPSGGDVAATASSTAPIPPVATPPKDSGAHNLLVRILDALTRKLGTLRYVIPRMTAADRAAALSRTNPDSSILPMESFFIVQPTTTAAAATLATSESTTPNNPPTSEVVPVSIFRGGHTGFKKKRPAIPIVVPAIPPRKQMENQRKLDRAFILGIGNTNEGYDLNDTSALPSTAANNNEPTTESMRDVCVLIRTIVLGMKTVFYCISKVDAYQQQNAGATPAAVAAAAVAAKSSLEEEVRLISKMFTSTLQCVSAYRVSAAIRSSTGSSSQASIATATQAELDAIAESEENEVLEMFASSFSVLDSAVFTDVLRHNIEFFYACMLENHRVQRVAMYFMRSPSMARPFASVFIPFALSRFALINGRFAGTQSLVEELFVDALNPISSDGLMFPNDLEEDDITSNNWTTLAAPTMKSPPCRLFDATYFGGCHPPKLDVSNVPRGDANAAFSYEGLGVISPDVWPEQATKPVKLDSYPRDLEANLLHKMVKSTFQAFPHMIRAGGSSPSSISTASATSTTTQTSTTSTTTNLADALVALLTAYLEPIVFACMTAAADTMTFPLEPLRERRRYVMLDSFPLPGKPLTDDVADNCISLVRHMFSVAMESPHEVRDSILSIVRRLSKPVGRAANKLLVYCSANERDMTMLTRADNLSDLCITLSMSLATEEPNLLTLPYAHALSAASRGNDTLVTKTLIALERLIPSGVFERVFVARGGLVGHSLKALFRNSVHGPSALRLHGKCTFEFPQQLIFHQERLSSESDEAGFVVEAGWMEFSSMSGSGVVDRSSSSGPAPAPQPSSKMNLARTIRSVCRYLDDSFRVVAATAASPTSTAVPSTTIPPSSSSIATTTQAEEMHKIHALKFLFSLKEKPLDVLEAIVTCCADTLLKTLAVDVFRAEVITRPDACAKALVSGGLIRACPHRGLAAKLFIVESASNNAFLQVILDALVVVSRKKSCQERTGALFGLKIILEHCSSEFILQNQIRLIETFSHVLKDHSVELGPDALTHAGDALHMMMKRAPACGAAVAEEMIQCCFRCDEPRARRIARASVIQARDMAYDDVALTKLCFDTLGQVLANPLPIVPVQWSTSSTSWMSNLCGRLEFALFVLEVFDTFKPSSGGAAAMAAPPGKRQQPAPVPGLEVAARKTAEFLHNVTSKLAKSLLEEDEVIHGDAETFTFTFYPRSVALKTALLRLSLRLGGDSTLMNLENPITAAALISFTFAALSSPWPSVSRSAMLLLKATASSAVPLLLAESVVTDTPAFPETKLAVTLKETGQKFVKSITEPIAAPSLSIHQVRAVDRAMSAFDKKIKIVPDTFAQDLLSTLGERFVVVKVLFTRSKKNTQGEELFVSAALIDLFRKIPPSSATAQILEPLLSTVFKMESYMHGFHFSEFAVFIEKQQQQLLQLNPNATAANTAATAALAASFKPILGSNCGSKLSSPFRTPLARFFATCPSQTLEHFVTNDRLIRVRYSSLLSDLLKRRVEGEPLRRELENNPMVLKLLTTATFEVAYEPPADAAAAHKAAAPNQKLNPAHDSQLRRAQARVVELRFQGVRLVRCIAKWSPNILAKHPELMNSVLAVLKAPDREAKMHVEEKLPLRHRTLSRIACKAVIAGFKAGGPVPPLLEMLPVSVTRSTTDNTFLCEFFSKTLPKCSRTRKEIVSHFTSFLGSSVTSASLKEAALRLVLIPLLSSAFLDRIIKNDPFEVESSTMESLVQWLLMNRTSGNTFAVLPIPSPSPPSASTAAVVIEASPTPSPTSTPAPPAAVSTPAATSALAAGGPFVATINEDLEVQALQMLSLLITHEGEYLMPHRKGLIRFAWNHLSGEDSPSKNWAYVNICTFIDVYHTPAEIILRVFIELLRAHSTEARDLICRALDMLTPALPRRLEVGEYIKAVKWTKKLLFDDGHHIPQLTHVWNMVTRHPQIFYQYRAQFVPHMINSLNRVGLPHNCPIENRELAVNVVELLLIWEKTREVEETKSAANVVMTNSSSPIASGREEAVRGFRMNHTMFSMMLNFLMRVALQLTETRDARSRGLSRRCVSLFAASLELAKRRVAGTRVAVSFTFLLKPLMTHYAKLRQTAEHEIAVVKRHIENPSTASKPLPPSAWERRTEPGVVCCVLEILTLIVGADPIAVARPFVIENAGELHLIIDPALASTERDIGVHLAKLLATLLEMDPLTAKVSPLNELPAVAVPSGDHPVPLLSSTSSQHPPKPFYPAFVSALTKRLTSAGDDAKKLETAAAVAASSTTTALKGRASGAKSRGAGATQAAAAAADNRPVAKALQIRIAKEIAFRQAEHMGAGSRGVLMMLKLLQILCALDDPHPFPELSIRPSALGLPVIADKVSALFMRLTTKMTKEMLAQPFGSNGNMPSAAGGANSSAAGASTSSTQQRQTNRPMSELLSNNDDLHQTSRRLLSNIVEICLAIMGTVALSLDNQRKTFMHLVATLLDKLDANDHVVLNRLVKIVGSWFISNKLTLRERSAFWSKLSNMDARLAGFPETVDLMVSLHDLALRSPSPPRSSLFSGILSPSPTQREACWSICFPYRGPGSNHTLLGQFFLGRKDDVSAVSHKFWIPIPLRCLLETSLVSKSHAWGDLIQVAFGDGSGDVATNLWMDALDSCWSHCDTLARKSFAENTSALLLGTTHATHQSMLTQYDLRHRAHASRLADATMISAKKSWDVKRIERVFMMYRASPSRVFFDSVFHLPFCSSFARPETLKYLGTSLDNKFSTIVALEESYEIHPETSSDSLLTSYSEFGMFMAGDEFVRGLLISAPVSQMSDPALREGLTLELGNRWGEAFKVYRAACAKTHVRTMRESGGDVIHEHGVDAISTLSAFKRARRDGIAPPLLGLDEYDDVTDDAMSEGEDEFFERPKRSHDARLQPRKATLLEIRAYDVRLKTTASKLGEWRALADWAKSEKDGHALCESTLRCLSVLDRVSFECARHWTSSASSSSTPSAELGILETCLAFKEGKPSSELEACLKRAVKTSLNLSPSPSKGFAQRLVELEESFSFHTRVSRASSEQRSQALTSLVNTWSNRVPTASVTIEEWSALVNWRLEFFKHAQSVYLNGSSSSNAILELQDASVLSLLLGARHARSKGALELAQSYVSQAKTFLKSSLLNEAANESVRITLVSPLNQFPIETLSRCYTDLDPFISKTNTNAASEMHRLRARLMSMVPSLAESSIVDEVFSVALRSDPKNVGVWADWGRVLLTKSSGSGAGNAAAAATLMCEAAVCFARAIALGHAGSRIMIPALALTDDVETSGGGGAMAQADAIPPNVFIPWISYLLESAPTSQFAKRALDRLAAGEPQSLLFELMCAPLPANERITMELLQLVREKHPEVVKEFDYLVYLLKTKSTDLGFLANGGECSWRAQVLRIPGTRRKLDRIVIKEKVATRKDSVERIEMFSDDGRSPVSFALRRNVKWDSGKKRVASLYWLVCEILLQDGSLSEMFVPPAVYNLSDSLILEKDARCSSLASLVQTENAASLDESRRKSILKRWFFQGFSDFETSCIARSRFIKQLAVHSFITALAKDEGVLRGGPHEILVGRGVESCFVVMGIDEYHPVSSETNECFPPFRLSPNLVTFATLQGLYGPFSSCFSNAARASAKREGRYPLLALLGNARVNSQDLLNETQSVRDAAILGMIRAAIEFRGLVSANWMAWC